MPGPKPAEIILTDAERHALEKLVKRHTTEQRKALRGRIVLLAAERKNTPDIARELKTSLDTVRLWRRRWDYFNRTMAKPFKWTYQGKALVI